MEGPSSEEGKLPCCKIIWDLKSFSRKGVLVRIIIAVMEHHDQNDLWRKRFIQVTLLHDDSSLKEVRTGTQPGQETGARS